MDNLFLTGLSGTTLNIGSWLRPYDKPDYGAKSLVQQVYAENPLSEGGVLAYERFGVRHMAFPVIAPSAAAVGGLSVLESQLRLVARPGAVLDVQPDGMSDLVRFDVIGGRYEEDYDTYENRVMRRKGTVYLDVQPFGYLPTQIIAASTASMALPGSIDLSGVSWVGDAPGLAELVVQPSVATNYLSGTWMSDAAWWSLAGRASAQAWWPAGSILSASLTGAYVANSFGPAATALRVFTNGQLSGHFDFGAEIVIPTALEPAYRGRFRVFLLAGNLASTNSAWGVGVDAVSSYNINAPMGSAGAVATVINATPAFGILDCGEITLPQTGSGLVQSQHVRFWTGPVGVGAAATTGVVIAGAYLHALDGANGVQARGIAGRNAGASYPTAPWTQPGRFVNQAYERRVLSAMPISDLSAHTPLANILGDYRGGHPLVAQASTSHLDVMTGQLAANASSTPHRASPASAAVSLTYRPRFSFLHGL